MLGGAKRSASDDIQVKAKSIKFENDSSDKKKFEKGDRKTNSKKPSMLRKSIWLNGIYWYTYYLLMLLVSSF